MMLITTALGQHSIHLRTIAIAALLIAPLTTASLLAATNLTAIAGGDSETVTGPLAISASAADNGFTATTTRTSTAISGATSGGFFTAISGSADARTTSDFTITGITAGAPLTFRWDFSGARSWSPENANVQHELVAGFSGGGFIYNFRWAIGYVDGPAFMGDFAGTLTSGAGISAAGSFGPDETLSFPVWDGQGTISPTLTLTQFSDGSEGSYGQIATLAFGGDVNGSYSIDLRSITVPNASFLTGPAFMTFDNGHQIAIMAVPEPSSTAAIAIALAGTLAIGRRRQGR
jgi:hypothetical protein